jgi:nucleotide-binding universal stress UspA family protein
MGWFAGSVAIDVLCGAPCPVLIVGDRAVHQPHDGPVVAGVDVEHADAVLEAAFGEADLRRSELVVVHAGGGDAGTWLREVVEPYERKYPHVRVTEEPRAGRPAHVLLSTSADAGLIVVGTRGRGPVTGLIFGSVGQRLLRHAHCPVLVVR